MKRLAISAIALALMTAPVSAQIKQLKCGFTNGTPPKLITIDYGAKTLTYDSIDEAGNIDPVTGGVAAGLANLPATITSESISAQSCTVKAIGPRWVSVSQPGHCGSRGTTP